MSANNLSIDVFLLNISLHFQEFLCEASYILLEYARTAMFMWMFIEGLYLHNVITVTVFQGRFPHIFYALLGWGTPVFLTSIWAVVTSIYFGSQK
jgi:PDF receptor